MNTRDAKRPKQGVRTGGRDLSMVTAAKGSTSLTASCILLAASNASALLPVAYFESRSLGPKDGGQEDCLFLDEDT